MQTSSLLLLGAISTAQRQPGGKIQNVSRPASARWVLRRMGAGWCWSGAPGRRCQLEGSGVGGGARSRASFRVLFLEHGSEVETREKANHDPNCFLLGGIERAPGGPLHSLLTGDLRPSLPSHPWVGPGASSFSLQVNRESTHQPDPCAAPTSSREPSCLSRVQVARSLLGQPQSLTRCFSAYFQHSAAASRPGSGRARFLATLPQIPESPQVSHFASLGLFPHLEGFTGL